MTKFEKPSCILDFEDQLSVAGRAIYEWTFHSKPFPYSFFELCIWHIESGKDPVSIWLSCHASEHVQTKFDNLNDELNKSILRLGVLERRLGRISPELAKSDRARELLDGARGDVEIGMAMMHGFLSDLRKAFEWNDKTDTAGSKETLLNDDRSVKDPKRPKDGLFADEQKEHWICKERRILFWFGIEYPPLDRNPFAVVQVLYEAFKKGESWEWVSLETLRQTLRDVRALDSGMAEVFKLRVTTKAKRKAVRRVEKHLIWNVIERRGGAGAYAYRLRRVNIPE